MRVLISILDEHNTHYGGTALILAVRWGAYHMRCVSEFGTCPHVCKFAKGYGPGEKPETRYFDTVKVKKSSIT
jgi:hypothetical protein